MNKLICFFFVLLINISLWAQSPEKMSYQAVIHNTNNQLVTNQQIGMRISILQGSISGSVVYMEKHSPTTNNNGIVSLEIGGGTVVSGSFLTINWAESSYFIKTETDPAGGTNYSITGTNQLLSVPYALYAKTAGNNFSGDYKDLTNKPSANNKGDMMYWNGSSWARLPVGANGSILTMFNGTPTWLGTFQNNETVTDIDGNVYHTVTIGTQTWLVENLKTTRYRNGESIPNCIDNIEWSNLNTGAYCNYNNNPDNGEIYGKLYNWHAVNDNRDIAPVGWHVPTLNDMYTLEFYLIENGYNFDGTTSNSTSNLAAKSLAAKTDWRTFTEIGTVGCDITSNNSTGFTALPGGCREYNGTFQPYWGGIGVYGYWWVAGEDGYGVIQTYMSYFSNQFYRAYAYSKNRGLSIRCIKD